MTALESAHLGRFRAIVAARLGLEFGESRATELSDVFEKLGSASPGGLEPFLARLEAKHPPGEDVRALARQLTVGETYFFRNPEQLRAFAEVALPSHLAARSSPGRVRILSAGCASGEEAYSLALIAGEQVARLDEEVSITAVDVNPAALERAAAGRYSAWSLRATPPDLRRRWFHPVGREYLVHPAARSAVRFEERNLADEGTDLWLPSAYEVIFCRNVLMYFTPETARSVIARIARALVPDGHLFLGHAEFLREMSQDFDVCQSHNTFYYQRKNHSGPARPGRFEKAPAPSAAPQAQADEPSDVGWIESVGRSSERIRELSERSDAKQQPPRTASDANPGPEAMDLLARERFVEALELLDRVPQAAGDPDLMLLRAVLLTHSGRIEAAEIVCSELRGQGVGSAGAHYLLALCREGAGDLVGAAKNDQMAVYLDPAFAMPRLHLGLLARRAGDLRAAQRELEQALVLLAREDASRILLFGGGFTREALTRLCRAELRAAGVAQ